MCRWLKPLAPPIFFPACARALFSCLVQQTPAHTDTRTLHAHALGRALQAVARARLTLLLAVHTLCAKHSPGTQVALVCAPGCARVCTFKSHTHASQQHLTCVQDLGLSEGDRAMSACFAHALHSFGASGAHARLHMCMCVSCMSLRHARLCLCPSTLSCTRIVSEG